jgi:hypothetical protein
MRLLAALLLVSVLLPASPAAAARIPLKPVPETSVGRVESTRAFVAVSVHRGKLRVYVCDGTLKRNATISTWFRHRWDGRRALTLRRGGHTLRLDPRSEDGRITGRLDGHAFRVERASRPAGLFRGHSDHVRATWIVLPSLEKRGTMVSTRKPCRFVLITGPNGQQQWVSVCN